jgi:hypothetical protein
MVHEVRTGFNRGSFDEDNWVLEIGKLKGMTDFNINPLFMEARVMLDVKARKAKAMENGGCEGEIRELKSALKLIKGRSRLRTLL